MELMGRGGHPGKKSVHIYFRGLDHIKMHEIPPRRLTHKKVIRPLDAEEGCTEI